MEQWRQCGRWLIDCKVLPPNHRVVWPSAVVFDLAQALRDGVLLCQLLHNLSPGSIDLKDINFRPQMSQVKVRTWREGPRSSGVCAAGRASRNAEVAAAGGRGTVAGAIELGRRRAAGGSGGSGRDEARLHPSEPAPPSRYPRRREVGQSPPSPGCASAARRYYPGALIPRLHLPAWRGIPAPESTVVPLQGLGAQAPRVSLPPREPAAPGGRAGDRVFGLRAWWLEPVEDEQALWLRRPRAGRGGAGVPGAAPLSRLRPLQDLGPGQMTSGLSNLAGFLTRLPSGPQMWPLSRRRQACDRRAGQEDVRSAGRSCFSWPLEGNLAES
jgi:hypothetical protein